jgi:hypothetical protein
MKKFICSFKESSVSFLEHLAMGFGVILYSGSLVGRLELSQKVKKYLEKKWMGKNKNS